MRHKNAGRKFDRNTSSRRAMFRNLTANLVLHERIETTDAKAKELRRVAERLLSKAIRLGEVAYTTGDKLSDGGQGAAAARRAPRRRVHPALRRTRIEKGGAEKRVDLVEKVFLDLAKRFKGRAGGYTRIVKYRPAPRATTRPISPDRVRRRSR